MKHLTLFLLSFLLHVAGHTQTQEPVEKLDLINRGAFKSGGREKQDCFAFGCVSAHNPESMPKWRECFAALCPSKAKTTMELAVERMPAGEKTPEHIELRDLFSKMFQHMLKDRQQRTEFFLKMLAENPKFESGPSRKLAAFSYYSNFAGNFTTDGNGKVDLKPSFDKFVANGNDPEDFKPAKIAFEIAMEIRGSFDHDTPIEDDKLAKLDSVQMKRRLLDAEKYREEAEKQYAKDFGIPLELALDQISYSETRRQIERGDVQPSRIESLREAYTYAKGLRLAAGKAERLTSEGSRVLRLSDLVNPGTKERLESQLKVMNQIQNANLDYTQDYFGRRADEAASKCGSAVGMGLTLSPSQAELKAFDAREMKTRAAYVEKMKTVLSAKSAAVLAGEAKKWSRKSSATRERFVADVRDRFKAEMESALFDDVLKSLSPQEHLGAALDIAVDDEFNGKDEPFSDLIELCTKKIPSVSEAHSVRGTNRFVLSVEGLLQPERATTEAFHEYSHLASYIFSKNKMSKKSTDWYKAQRACLDQAREGMDLRTEEHWAESLANFLAPNEVSYICNFKAENLSEENFTLQNVEHDPTHPSQLYALMERAAISPKGIPEVCREALAERGETKMPVNCFAKVNTPAEK